MKEPFANPFVQQHLFLVTKHMITTAYTGIHIIHIYMLAYETHAQFTTAIMYYLC